VAMVVVSWARLARELIFSSRCYRFCRSTGFSNLSCGSRRCGFGSVVQGFSSPGCDHFPYGLCRVLWCWRIVWRVLGTQLGEFGDWGLAGCVSGRLGDGLVEGSGMRRRSCMTGWGERFSCDCGRAVNLWGSSCFGLVLCADSLLVCFVDGVVGIDGTERACVVVGF
jgi:hypothetical protein